MTNDHNKHTERILGYYKTPEKTAEYMVTKILSRSKKDFTILDPAVGDGVFLKMLKMHGISCKKLHGYDINEKVIKDLITEFPNVKLKDSLLEQTEQFDLIIANPPYNSNECDYIKKNRNELKRKFQLLGAINLYPLFIYACIEKLKEGGTLCMIVLDSFLSNIYYKPLREYILRTCKIEEILLAPSKLFNDQDADVRTAIITLTKCSGLEKNKERSENLMRLIDRLGSESDYPRAIPQILAQKEFEKMPDNIFFIGTLPKIIELFTSSKKTVGDFAKGGTGISTGNDSVFLKTKKDAEKLTGWVGFYKSGKRKPYYYETNYYIHSDWESSAKKTKNFMIRNKEFFFKEGITCSSVGLKFSAAYLPPGNLFGVNTNLFFTNETELYCMLGFLNSKVAWYMARQVINRTNNISARYVKMIPYIEPPRNKKEEIVIKVKNIVKKLMKDENADFETEQHEIDKIFFDIYKLSNEEIVAITSFCDNIYEKI